MFRNSSCHTRNTSFSFLFHQNYICVVPYTYIIVICIFSICTFFPSNYVIISLFFSFRLHQSNCLLDSSPFYGNYQVKVSVLSRQLSGKYHTKRNKKKYQLTQISNIVKTHRINCKYNYKCPYDVNELKSLWNRKNQ